MKVRFIEKGHRYDSIPKIKWTSATKLVEKFVPTFDDIEKSEECSLNPRSKWFNIDPIKIRRIWEIENKRSTDCGTWYHNLMEGKALAAGGKVYKGVYLKVIPPILKPGYKLAPDQKLVDGIYPEHFMYNEDLAICGQSDLVYVCNGVVDIDDYKTNKELKFKGFGYQQEAMMLGPMSKYGDANFWHYALQLSIYMKLILLKNPHLKPGRMRIYHVTFENEGHDRFGFPILKRTPDGGYVVAGGKWYNIPYLEKEVNQIFKLREAQVGRTVS